MVDFHQLVTQRRQLVAIADIHSHLSEQHHAHQDNGGQQRAVDKQIGNTVFKPGRAQIVFVIPGHHDNRVTRRARKAVDSDDLIKRRQPGGAALARSQQHLRKKRAVREIFIQHAFVKRANVQRFAIDQQQRQDVVICQFKVAVKLAEIVHFHGGHHHARKAAGNVTEA